MSDNIRAIAETINSPCPEQCDHDAAVYGCACASCTHAAKRIYTAHVKPLEDALAKSEADKKEIIKALKIAMDAIGVFTKLGLLKGAEELLAPARATLARVKGEA